LRKYKLSAHTNTTNPVPTNITINIYHNASSRTYGHHQRTVLCWIAII